MNTDWRPWLRDRIRAVAMTTLFVRLGRLAVVAGALLVLSSAAKAQEKTPLPPFTGERVIVSGVPDVYQGFATDHAAGKGIAAVLLRGCCQVNRARRVGHQEIR